MSDDTSTAQEAALVAGGAVSQALRWDYLYTDLVGRLAPLSEHPNDLADEFTRMFARHLAVAETTALTPQPKVRETP